MSIGAVEYVTALEECPDGADLDCAHKAVLWCIANHHNKDKHCAEPGFDRIQRQSRVKPSRLKECLQYLEAHCVLRRVKSASQGRGEYTRYLFLALDSPAELNGRLKQLQQGPAGGPLFQSAGLVDILSQILEFVTKSKQGGQSEGARKGPESEPERGQEGATGHVRNKEEPGNPKPTLEIITARAALNIWLAVKRDLETRLPQPEVALWVRPARLQRTLSQQHMLIALPPSNRIIQAAQQRIVLLRSLLAPHGYNASFVKYADAYDREEHRRRFGTEVQTYGNATVSATTADN